MVEAATVESIVATFYQSLSGPAGERDFSRLRALFRPDARLVRTAAGLEELTVDRFLADLTGFFREVSLYEREVARRIFRFGHVAQVFSVYEGRLEPEGPVLARGVNAMQLVFDGTRWWFAAIAWDDETPERPIPVELLD